MDSLNRKILEDITEMLEEINGSFQEVNGNLKYITRILKDNNRILREISGTLTNRGMPKEVTKIFKQDECSP